MGFLVPVPLSASRPTLPWRLLTPHANFSHLSLEGDRNDHRIPKGFPCTSFLCGLQHAGLVLSRVLGTLWVVSRDKRVYPDPGVSARKDSWGTHVPRTGNLTLGTTLLGLAKGTKLITMYPVVCVVSMAPRNLPGVHI